MLMQGKNAGNPDGLPSILTQQKRKLTIENRGSDNFCHPMPDSPYNIITKLKTCDTAIYNIICKYLPVCSFIIPQNLPKVKTNLSID